MLGFHPISAAPISALIHRVVVVAVDEVTPDSGGSGAKGVRLGVDDLLELIGEKTRRIKEQTRLQREAELRALEQISLTDKEKLKLSLSAEQREALRQKMLSLGVIKQAGDKQKGEEILTDDELIVLVLLLGL